MYILTKSIIFKNIIGKEKTPKKTTIPSHLLASSQNLINFAPQSTFYRKYMNKQIEDIKAIREMMERSSKFLSLSGLSGISAGVIAIIGAALAYFHILREPDNGHFEATHEAMFREIVLLITDASAVLLFSICFGIYFSWRKSVKKNLIPSKSLIKRTLYHLGIPLVAGGIFALIFLLRGDLAMAITMTLTFYGLALINVSKYTLDEVHYLGLTEVALGIVSALFPSWSLLLWTIGFGLCHIIYGTVMYIKYDLKKE